jgi:hypothetical protein
VSDPRDFAYLISSTKRSVELLRGALQKADIGPSRRGHVLVAHIERPLGGIEQRVSEAEANFDSSESAAKHEYVKQVRLLDAWVRHMHRAIPWIVNASNPSFDLGALYFIDETGYAITDRALDAIPNAASQFSTERRPFERVFALLGIENDSNAIPVILNYPMPESGSHLLLPLYGHELAHARVGEEDLHMRVLELHAGDQPLQSAFQKAIKDTASGGGGSELEAAYRLRSRLHLWVTELLCDQFAVQWLGPSYLFSFSSFLLAQSWEESLERHPPTSLRIQHLLNYLEEGGWNDAVRHKAAEVLLWLEGVGAQKPDVSGDLEASFLLDALSSVVPTIQRVVAEALGERAYGTGEFEAVTGYIDELVECDVLPVQLESGKAIDRRAILLSAWLNSFSSADYPATLADAPGNLKAQRFIAKAIEMSAVLARWRELD